MCKNIKLCSLIKPEIDRCYELCNFTYDESEYFKLKTKDKSNVAIAQEMNVSEAQVSKLARRVKDKILKLIELGLLDME